jgi:hypothetical protein
VTGGHIVIRRAVAYSLLGGSVFVFLAVNLGGGNTTIVNPICGCVFWLAWILDRRRNGFGNRWSNP